MLPPICHFVNAVTWINWFTMDIWQVTHVTPFDQDSRFKIQMFLFKQQLYCTRYNDSVKETLIKVISDRCHESQPLVIIIIG